MEKKEEYLIVWGDTVDFKQLIIGLFVGSLVGYLSFIGGHAYLINNHSDLTKGLLMGYSLLFGVGGCLVIWLITAAIFKPKRIFHEEGFVVDQELVLRELNIDVKKETEYLKEVPAEIIVEMKKLELHDLFIEKPQCQGGEKK